MKIEFQDDGKSITAANDGSKFMRADYSSFDGIKITSSSCLPWDAEEAEEILKASLEVLNMARTRFHDRMQLTE